MFWDCQICMFMMAVSSCSLFLFIIYNKSSLSLFCFKNLLVSIINISILASFHISLMHHFLFVFNLLSLLFNILYLIFIFYLIFLVNAWFILWTICLLFKNHIWVFVLIRDLTFFTTLLRFIWRFIYIFYLL